MAIKFAVERWREDGTKMLGTLGAILPGTLLIDGLVPQGLRKWVLLADLIIGAFTIKRGYTNTSNAATPLPPPAPETLR